MPKLTALERLWQGVEERCNSDEGLLRLAKALLAHKPQSDIQLRYIRALVYYVFMKRRYEIYRRRGLVLHSAQQRRAGNYGATCLQSEVELARECRDSVGMELAQEEGAEAVQALRKRIGSQLSFAGAYNSLSRNLLTFE